MAALLLMIAVVLCITVRLMRDALRELRLIEEDRRIHHLMLIAGGSADVSYAAQQLAVAMLADYPRAANSLEQLHSAINRYAMRGGNGDMGRWRELNVQIVQTLNQIKTESSHPDRAKSKLH